MKLLGSPSEEELGLLSEKAKLYLRQPPYHGPQSFFVVFPNVPYSAIELIKKMLMFDPRQRISGLLKTCLIINISEMHDITDEPMATLRKNNAANSTWLIISVFVICDIIGEQQLIIRSSERRFRDCVRVKLTILPFRDLSLEKFLLLDSFKALSASSCIAS
ncbi:hypothetical protein Bca52824_025107 [Brassica carinata]|uniref:Protein kinase domain-containing protein n=1 Tax=Brassica carinata TaxID=52824 RepID=A0A8X7VLJ3_BRACI|nr:hypothetical protein Bca52824_025107 [Brassica carinata]